MAFGLLKSNQELKSSEESKRSGIKKLRRLHNSVILFYKGVPVRRSLERDLINLEFIDTIDLLFFNL